MLDLRSRLTKLRASSLARNTGWMTIGQGANFFLQAGYFLLVARLLGATEYGAFAGAFALVNFLTPYSSLGLPMIFMRYVSADRGSAQIHWGNILVTIAATSVLIAAILALVGSKLLGAQTIGLIVVLVFSSCCMSQIVNAASTVFQTFEHLKATAALQALSNSLRLLAIGILLIKLHHATAFQCALGILASSGFAAAIAILWVRNRIGRLRLSGTLLRLRFWEGIGFSFAGSTQSAYNDVDKLMLSHYGMNAANGIYTMAYRIVDFATTPVTAIDAAVLPRYFALNREGFATVRQLARRVIPVALLTGLGAAGITLLLSPLVVQIAGRDFAATLVAIRWLCLLPALRAVHQLAGGVLTATGMQGYRTSAQFLVALLNVVLNLIWIPSHGWLGAAWASLISDSLLGVLNLFLVFIAFSFMNRNRRLELRKEQAQ